MEKQQVGSERRLTAHEFACEALRNQILSGELVGGSRLVQSELAQQLGLSTTPIREALRDLATEGLVHIEPHHGAVVHQVSDSEMREIYEMRRRLEPLVIELAVQNITESQLTRAKDLQDRLTREADPVKWVTLNREFHEVFMEACGWPRLAATVRSLHAGASPYVTMTMRFRPDMLEEGNRDHARLLTAFVRRDVRTAVELVVPHMDIVKSALGPAFAADGPVLE